MISSLVGTLEVTEGHCFKVLQEYAAPAAFMGGLYGRVPLYKNHNSIIVHSQAGTALAQSCRPTSSQLNVVYNTSGHPMERMLCIRATFASGLLARLLACSLAYFPLVELPLAAIKQGWKEREHRAIFTHRKNEKSRFNEAPEEV